MNILSSEDAEAAEELREMRRSETGRRPRPTRVGARASNSILAFIYIISPPGWSHSEQDVLDDVWRQELQTAPWPSSTS